MLGIRGGGRLGTGSNNGESTPTLANYFSSTNQAVDVALGRYTGCALMANGSVTCWGEGYLGDGNGETTKTSPGLAWVNLPTGRTVVSVEMGRKHACMQLDNGVVKCWGDDQYGQMANGNGENDRNNPTTVNFASGIEAVSIHAGHWHNCITAQTNEVYCWGDGKGGKLGDGGTTQHNFAGAAAKQTTSQVQSRFSTTVPSRRGRCTQPFQPACRWVPPTAPFGARRPLPSHKRTSPSTPTTRAGPPRSCSTWGSILRHRVRSSTSQRTTRSQTTPRFTSHRNSSTKQLETAPCGMWPTSTAVQQAVTLDNTWNSLLVIPSISQQMMEPRVLNCGRMTLPTIPHGK